MRSLHTAEARAPLRLPPRTLEVWARGAPTHSLRHGARGVVRDCPHPPIFALTLRLGTASRLSNTSGVRWLILATRRVSALWPTHPHLNPSTPLVSHSHSHRHPSRSNSPRCHPLAARRRGCGRVGARDRYVAVAAATAATAFQSRPFAARRARTGGPRVHSHPHPLSSVYLHPPANASIAICASANANATDDSPSSLY